MTVLLDQTLAETDLALNLYVPQASVCLLTTDVIENRIGSHFRAALVAGPILRRVHELAPNTSSPVLRRDKPALEISNRACVTSISIFPKACFDETLDRTRLRLRNEDGKPRRPLGDAGALAIVLLIGKTRPQSNTHVFPRQDVRWL